jgi:hypothetical protein
MDRREIKRARRAWLDERDSATVYQALATIEADPRLGGLFSRLAASELEHAAYWGERLTALGQAVPAYRPSLRARVLIELARWFGVSFVVPSITARELADRDRYTSHADPRTARLWREERGHAAVLHAIGAGQALGGEERWEGMIAIPGMYSRDAVAATGATYGENSLERRTVTRAASSMSCGSRHIRWNPPPCPEAWSASSANTGARDAIRRRRSW